MKNLIKKKQFIIILFILFSLGTAFSEPTPRKNALKTTFLSFYTGSAKLTYERSVFLNQSIEITGGIIGVGFDSKKNNPKGGLFRYAHKFIFFSNPKFPLNGFYVKPEFALSSFNYDSVGNTMRKNSTMGALMACVGYQWARRMFTVDAFVGAGGALGSPCDTYYEHGFILWNMFNTECKYVSLTFGLKLGLNFGKEKNKEVLLREEINAGI